jgi:hypothetical protein
MIQWARAKGWGVRGHCLFWDVEDDSHYPDWVKPLTGQDMVDAIYGRLESAVNHYRVITNRENRTGALLRGPNNIQSLEMRDADDKR